MKAAVLASPTGVPQFADFADPELAPGEVSARVLAAGLHPLVRGQATGQHYTSHGVYPLIPGVDGVAELPDGRRVYIGWLRPPFGTFAERAAVRPERALPLPDGVAPEVIAGTVNPASSGWLALRLRARMQPGESVMILGATGAAGQLAVQLARALGARRVVAAGRNTEVLARLPADATLRLDAPDLDEQLRRELTEHGTDIILDYVWGPPASATLAALLAVHTSLAGRRVRYVNIGSIAGPSIAFSPSLLRSAPVELLGSGFGSVSPAELVGELPGLLERIARGEVKAAIEAVPLSQVSEAWSRPADGGRRVVLMPG